jgi:hypothetical protein
MPFSAEELNIFFQQTDSSQNSRLWPANLKDNENFSQVFDYLTGKINALHNLIDSYSNMNWPVLFQLIENLNTPSEKDQLIIDLLYHPALIGRTQLLLGYYLYKHITAHNDPQSFDAAMALLKKKPVWVIRKFLPRCLHNTMNLMENLLM